MMFGKLPCTLKDPVEGVELMHCSTAIMKTKLFLLNPGSQLSAKFSYLVPWRRPSQEGLGLGLRSVIRLYLEHTLYSPFLHRGTTTMICHSRGIVPDHHVMLQRRVTQDSPTTSSDLRYSGGVSSTHDTLPPRS